MTYLDVWDLIYGLKWMENVAGKQSAGGYCHLVIIVCGTEILMEKFDIPKTDRILNRFGRKEYLSYQFLALYEYKWSNRA